MSYEYYNTTAIVEEPIKTKQQIYKKKKLSINDIPYLIGIAISAIIVIILYAFYRRFKIKFINNYMMNLL